MADGSSSRPDDFRLTPLTAADIPAVRRLHAHSFAVLAGSHHDDAQVAAHAELIAGPDYERDLLGANLHLAWDASGRLVGTAGWQPFAERKRTARIRKVFVDPGVARRGLGKRLVADAEARARDAGYADFFVRANINAVPLYRALGYRELEAGKMVVGRGIALPVVFMEKLAG